MSQPLTPQHFVAKWRGVIQSERATAQSHFIDLCRLIDHPTPTDADPSGEWFAFEAGVTKTGGGDGWADVWLRRHFGWEYKGKHANLERAYQQLLQYRESLENPPLLVVCDIERIVVHTNFTNTVKQTYTITLDDLLTPQGLDRLKAVFRTPDTLRATQTTEQVTRQAAEKFALLADHLRKQGHAPERIAHFLIRLLFCLFAEDIDLLPKGRFAEMVATGRNDPQGFAQMLGALFQVMAKGGYFGAERIRHFDGGLFDEAAILELDYTGLGILHSITYLDWAAIEPSILGTLFERSLDPNKRAMLGAHYTSKEDILLIVEPVLMAPLRREWATVQTQARELAERRDTAQTQRTRNERAAELRSLLSGFSDTIAATRVLDPACGSGNFLYVALQQLLNLEKAVSVFAGEVGLPGLFPQAGPEQLYGIEVNEYAHELAQATVWIGYIQWLHENGYGVPAEPILKPLDTIKQMDAILAYDAAGRPVEPEWPPADVIVGNPPFLGGNSMRAELGSKYVDDLRSLYSGRVPGGADLVAYWFERSREAIAQGRTRSAGLLATQSIRAGASRAVLEQIKQSGDIFYAQADRPWILDGADVRVSMVGFDDGSEQNRLLNTNVNDPAAVALANARSVASIHANLTAEADLTYAKPLPENAGLCFQGPVKVGPFELEDSTARAMIIKTNPHLRPNSDVIKPWMNASDVTGCNRKMWIIDFADMPMADAALYEAPFEYVRQHVKPMRDENNRKRRREYWWHHGETVPGLRLATRSISRIIVTPRVAKHRVFIWASAELVPDSRLYAFTREDDYFFGVLHSRIHEVWSLATSSRHGDGDDGGRPTYNNTTCFETFPVPWPPEQEPLDDPRVQAIAAAAKHLNDLRENWLNPPGAAEADLKKRTLTALYNARPTWLALAHDALDKAVFAAYGWPADLNDEEILARLLALNLARAGVRSA